MCYQDDEARLWYGGKGYGQNMDGGGRASAKDRLFPLSSLNR